VIVADYRFSPRNLLGSVEIRSRLRGSAEVYEGLKGSMNFDKLEATMGRGAVGNRGPRYVNCGTHMALERLGFSGFSLLVVLYCFGRLMDSC